MANVIITTINFHGADLVAIEGKSPQETLVALKPIVEAIGLDWGAQHKKVTKHPVLSGGISLKEIPSISGDQDTVLISLDMLNFWLATIHPDRIKNETTRARIIEYQTECARVLFNHFFGKVQGRSVSVPSKDITVSHLKKLENQQANVLAAFTLLNEKINAVEQTQNSMVIVNSSLTARISETLKEINGMNEGQIFEQYLPMKRKLENEGVPSFKRGRLVAIASKRCLNFALESGTTFFLQRSRETGRWLFHQTLLNNWMKYEGRLMIVDHMTMLRRQYNLELPKPKKKIA
ncbi:phage antirepressor N-terminal domain-containing protein [Entomobacter blattae]|uniref:Antirepressor protein ant N-terminal domain-containing protein n=1 Tax=Entomobacter blattae TaxID=2762277 RepID=A0A7H1NU29_9PROT|nr:phage antirepressor N-terminal domain-containing protein [Entomobacter blattae]QNT79289.1 hypothetical protein JGUZn3_20860 [Entomobacter blattae]